MNAQTFRRLVWKEYRTQRAFWIAVLVLTVFLELLLLLSSSVVDAGNWSARPAGRTLALFNLAMAFPALYALGLGGTMFASEHETGTFDLQRMLPVSAPWVFWSKLGFAVASALAMVAVLWPVTAAIAGWHLPSHGETVGLWAFWGLAAVELLVWGMLFSLTSEHPLRATILGIACASFFVHMITAHYVGSAQGFFALEAYVASFWPRLIVVAAVAAADVWLGMRWFREITASEPLFRRRRRAADEAEPFVVESRPHAVVGFSRLLWQAWRQSGTLLIVLAVTLLPLALYIAASVLVFRSDPWQRDEFWRSIYMLFAVSAPVFAGVCTFIADQRCESFRFLTERGVRPTFVWLSRQMVAAPLLLAAGVGLALVCFLSLFVVAVGPNVDKVVLLLVAYAILAYCAGQLMSMLFRSGIIAAVSAAVLTGALIGWTALMWAAGVPMVWSVVPLPLAFLAATWVRTPSWLRQRGGLLGWLPAVLVAVVPAAAIVVAVPFYRVYEVPLVAPGFSLDEFTRPRTVEEKKTLDMYREAARTLTPMPHVDRAERESGELTPKLIQWVANNEKAIQLAIAASKQPPCDFFDPLRWTGRFDAMDSQLRPLLSASGQVLQSEGKLDDALDRYLAMLRISVQLRARASFPWIADRVERAAYQRLLDWSAQPDQTSERIHTAIEQVETLIQNLPSRTSGIESEYYLMHKAIEGNPEAVASLGMNEKRITAFTLRMRWLPGEREHAARVLNLITRETIVWYEAFESLLEAGRKIPLHFYEYRRNDSIPEEGRFDFAYTALDASWMDRFTWNWGTPWETRQAMDMATRRRAALVLLALRAWELEHGELPKSLDELVGVYLEKLPIDPYAGEPFRYFPKGVPVEIVPPDERDRFELKPGVPPNTPIIWSAGPEVEVGEPPLSELDIWQSGWAFAVP